MDRIYKYNSDASYKPNGGTYLQLITAKDLYIQNVTVAENDGHSDSFQVKFQTFLLIIRLLRCVKARVQNLMKNGIQNLICIHFNLLFCKNHHEILTVNVNHHC